VAEHWDITSIKSVSASKAETVEVGYLERFTGIAYLARGGTDVLK
jgi:ethanolamine utilization microcompartment shell protein EutS